MCISRRNNICIDRLDDMSSIFHQTSQLLQYMRCLSRRHREDRDDNWLHRLENVQFWQITVHRYADTVTGRHSYASAMFDSHWWGNNSKYTILISHIAALASEKMLPVVGVVLQSTFKFLQIIMHFIRKLSFYTNRIKINKNNNKIITHISHNFFISDIYWSIFYKCNESQRKTSWYSLLLLFLLFLPPTCSCSSLSEHMNTFIGRLPSHWCIGVSPVTLLRISK